MSVCRHRPVAMSLALLAVFWCALIAQALEQQTGQTWALLGGKLSIELPPDWGPAGLGDVRTPFDLDGIGRMALCRPDGAGFCAVYRFKGLDSTDDAGLLRRSLLRNCSEAGIRTEECIVNLVGGRRFAIANGSWIDGEWTVSLVVAATVLDGEPVILVFGAKGPESGSIILAGQMALLSARVNDEGGLAGINYPMFQMEPPTEDVPIAGAGIRLTSRSVPGTGVTLSLPSHLIPALLTPGYIASDLGVSVFVEPVGLPYLQALGFMNRDHLRRSGMALESSTEVEVDHRPGRISRISFNSDRGPMSSWVLMTGHGDRSIKVVARFPKSQEAEFAEILREGLLETVWIPGSNTYGLDDLEYTFEETKHLRIICRAHERVILGVSGSSLPVKRTGPLVVIDSSMRPGTFPDLASLGRNIAEATNLVKDVEIVGESESQFAGFRVHEIQGTATEEFSGTLMYFYQAILQQEGRCLVVRGMQDMYGHADLRDEFIQVAHGLRLKKMNN